jgi:hypothetical protein
VRPSATLFYAIKLIKIYIIVVALKILIKLLKNQDSFMRTPNIISKSPTIPDEKHFSSSNMKNTHAKHTMPR